MNEYQTFKNDKENNNLNNVNNNFNDNQSYSNNFNNLNQNINQFKSNMIPENNVNNFQNMKIEPNLVNFNINDQKLSESVIIDNNKFADNQNLGNQFKNEGNMGIGYGINMKFGEENPYLLFSGNNNKSQNFFGDNNLSSEHDKKDVPSS